MPQRATVLLLIPHLGGGGAERVTTLLTRGLSAQKYDLHLGLITQSEIDCDQIPVCVQIHALTAHRVRSSALSLLRLVRQLQPDVILSGMAHLNFLVLLLRPFFPRKTRVLVRQNATVSSDLNSGQLPFYTRFLYRLLYPRADGIVCQTQAMADNLIVHARISKAHVQVLPNPVDIDAIRAWQPDAVHLPLGAAPHLLAVGRLAREKGFDLLLEAFSSLRLKFPDADLTIAGSGPEEAFLKALSRSLHLESSVHFVGHVPHPELWFPDATMFVLPSRYEGLPNALLEAAAGGLPLVALPASDGVVHLLKGKRGVWLAADVSSEALTHTLLEAIHSIQPGQRFPHSWVESFHADYAVQAYEHLIDQTLCEVSR